MDEQIFFIKGNNYGANDERLQAALAQIHETPERPRCMCIKGGVAMYVAKHRAFLVKRMPETGAQHHPSCPSYASDSQQSGLGELMGEAVIEHSPESVELRVDFPLTRVLGKSRLSGEQQMAVDIAAAKRRMSLRALMHYLFDRAQLNRWTPAMEGKRNQGVLHKYLMQAAEGIQTKGVSLSERLYVPEAFSEANKPYAAERRRSKLAFLGSASNSSMANMALILGEFKCTEETVTARKVWVKHMPDVPLLVDSKTWSRIDKRFGRVFESRDADVTHKPRVMMCALIYAKREHTYQIDTASFVLTTQQWIPVSGVEEIDLIHALIAQNRRFIKPLQYDAKSAAAFPNALLLDVGDVPVALHVVSGFMNDRDRSVKEKRLKSNEWVWNTDCPMPALPVAVSRSSIRPNHARTSIEE